MKTRRVLLSMSWLLTLAAGIGLGTAIGQQRPPTETKGVDAKVVSTVDLGPDIPGYQLRLRRLTVGWLGSVAGRRRVVDQCRSWQAPLTGRSCRAAQSRTAATAQGWKWTYFCRKARAASWSSRYSSGQSSRSMAHLLYLGCQGS